MNKGCNSCVYHEPNFINIWKFRKEKHHCKLGYYEKTNEWWEDNINKLNEEDVDNMICYKDDITIELLTDFVKGLTMVAQTIEKYKDNG